MNRYKKAATFTPFLIAICAFASGNNYKNFDVAIYSRVYETQQMKDPRGSKAIGQPSRET